MFTKKITKWLFYLNARLNRVRSVRRLTKSSLPVVSRFLKAYLLQTKGNFDEDESERINRINKLRAELLTDRSTVSYKKIGGLKDGDELSEQVVSIGEVCRNAASPKKWGEFQFHLIRCLQPDNCLELGTNLGVSGIYMLSAMELNNKGHLITMEGNPEFAKAAVKNMESFGFKHFECVQGLFMDTLDGTLKKYGSINYVFIDGHHDKKATLDYYRIIKPYLEPNSTVVFDDINWSKGMQEAWAEIASDKDAAYVFDFYKLGMVIYNPEQTKLPEKFNLSL